MVIPLGSAIPSCVWAERRGLHALDLEAWYQCGRLLRIDSFIDAQATLHSNVRMDSIKVCAHYIEDYYMIWALNREFR
jgi:hypothetical protein